MTRETEESLQALGYLAPRAERGGMQGIDPKDGLPLHNKLEAARHFAQRKKWERAEALLLEVIAVTPRNVSALNVLGLVNVKSGNRDRAVEYYNRSLAIDPQQFRVHGVLGALALLDADLAGAERFFQRALAVNPQFVEAMVNLGFIESLRGNQSAAEAWYRKGVAADPTFPRVYRRLGDLYYERGDFARAYEEYQHAVRIVPSDARATLQAGNCARRLGRVAEANALFGRAEQLHPAAWVPAYNRACLLATTGQAEAALAALQALAARHPLSFDLVEGDADLRSVRALPAYAPLRRKLQADVDDDDDSEDAD